MSKYQVMPPLSVEEYEALKADIAKRGVLVPVVTDEYGEIIDGHHRVQACQELGIADWPVDVRAGLTEDEKLELAYTLNYARRQVSKEQKQADAEKLRQQSWSYRRIARVLGVGERTARRWCGEEGASYDAPETVTGSDGKQYPAARPKAEAPPADSYPVPAKVEDDAVAAPVNTVYQPEQEPTREGIHNHRALGTGENEWYTPAKYIEMARQVMGDIDLDPATSEIAQEHIEAGAFFTKQDDGLAQDWFGRVWLNPPYTQPEIAHFVKKLVSEIRADRVAEAIMLTHNYTDTAWFHLAESICSAICFTRGRIRFESPGGELAAPTQGQAFFYYGPNVERFRAVFGEVGFVR